MVTLLSLNISCCIGVSWGEKVDRLENLFPALHFHCVGLLSWGGCLIGSRCVCHDFLSIQLFYVFWLEHLIHLHLWLLSIGCYSLSRPFLNCLGGLAPMSSLHLWSECTSVQCSGVSFGVWVLVVAEFNNRRHFSNWKHWSGFCVSKSTSLENQIMFQGRTTEDGTCIWKWQWFYMWGIKQRERRAWVGVDGHSLNQGSPNKRPGILCSVLYDHEVSLEEWGGCDRRGNGPDKGLEGS